MAITRIATVSIDAGSGNVSITHGLTILAGDVIVASINANGAGKTVTDNNGSTPFTFADFGENPDSARLYIFHRVCGGSEPAAYAFTLGSSGRWSIVLRQYRGVDNASVWDVAPSASTRSLSADPGTDATAEAASININTAGACGLVLMGDDWAPTTTLYSSVNNGYGNAKSESGQQYQATADKLGLATGATGVTTITSDATVTWVIYQVALKPASDSVTVTPAAVTAKGATVNPAVVLGSLTLTAIATAKGATVDPVVVLGSLTLVPAAVAARGVVVDPQVILGSITITPVFVFARAITIDPTVIGGEQEIPPLGQGDTDGFIIFMISNAVYHELTDAGLGAGLEEPNESNAAFWGEYLFGP